MIIKSGYTADVYDTALANFIGGILPGRAQLIVGRSNLANPNRAAAKGYNYRLVEFGFITNATDVSIFNNHMDDIARGVLSAFGISSGAPAGWVLDDTGWWYRDAGGGYPVSCWRQIGNDWYYFDGRGYAVSGQWLQDGGHWYYLKEDCRMVTGWLKLEDSWYYCNKDNDCQPVGSIFMNHWITDNGKRYYLKDDGKMACDETLVISGKEYSFDSSGKQV